MAPSPVNEPDAHRFFSAQCFNRAWELIRRPDRTDLESEQMLLLAQSSLWHWTQRPDCTPRNLSIGYWQLSRVYALLGQGDNAARSAETSLRHSEGTSPFLVGYAHEALARSAAVAGDELARKHHLAEAWRCSAQVSDERDRALLDADLRSLEKGSDH